MHKPARYFILALGICSATLAICAVMWRRGFEETGGIAEMQSVVEGGKTNQELVVVFERSDVSKKDVIHSSDRNPLLKYRPGDSVRVLYRAKQAEIWDFGRVWGWGLGYGVSAALLLGFGLFSRSNPQSKSG